MLGTELLEGTGGVGVLDEFLLVVLLRVLGNARLAAEIVLVVLGRGLSLLDVVLEGGDTGLEDGLLRFKLAGLLDVGLADIGKLLVG